MRALHRARSGLWLIIILALAVTACSESTEPAKTADAGALDGAASDGGATDSGSPESDAAQLDTSEPDMSKPDTLEPDVTSGDVTSGDAGSFMPADAAAYRGKPAKSTVHTHNMSTITTKKYRTADQMLLANEINESGEPFAEALGYDLDKLDPLVAGKPDNKAYVLGIENYEYSRYQLGTVISRSGIGLHMMWAPLIQQAAAAQPQSFDGSMSGGKANGFKEDDQLKAMIKMFATLAKHAPPGNPWPQFAEFQSADPHLPQAIDAKNFVWNDFTSLRWDRTKMDKILNPAAMGQTLMKQYLWAQDMLSGFHDKDDNAIEADGVVSPDKKDSFEFDPNNNVFYGGDGLDGFIGMVLTAESINKIAFLKGKLAFDGQKLGGIDLANYNPAKGIQFFPHGVGVTEKMVLKGMPPRVDSMKVTDDSSRLWDQVSLLWGISSFVNMMDPSDTSDSAHKAYRAVFDGSPFPNAMSVTQKPGPYDLMKGTARAIFLNLQAMHHDKANKVMVDKAWLKDGKVQRGVTVSAVASTYLIVALEVFIEEFAKTPLEAAAIAVVNNQAAFLTQHLSDGKGLYAEVATLKDGTFTVSGHSLGSQAAAIRGLYVAHRITGNTTYLDAANQAYAVLLKTYHADTQDHFRTLPAGMSGAGVATFTPKNVALLSGALREASLEGKQGKAADIYVAFWLKVVEKMQLSEGANTGETGKDSDKDGIPFIPEQPDNLPPVFASQGQVSL